MKWTTIAKIAFCILLCAVMVCAGLGVRFGRDRLHATLADVRNTDYYDDVFLDFAHNADKIRGLPFTAEEFRARFIDTTTEYYGMRLLVTAQNRTKSDVTILGIEVRDGKENEHILFLCRRPEVSVTIPAETKEPKNIWFRMLGDDFEDDALLSLLRKEFGLKLLYVDASTGVTNLDEADESQIRSEWVRAIG